MEFLLKLHELYAAQNETGLTNEQKVEVDVS